MLLQKRCTTGVSVNVTLFLTLTTAYASYWYIIHIRLLKVNSDIHRSISMSHIYHKSGDCDSFGHANCKPQPPLYRFIRTRRTTYTGVNYLSLLCRSLCAKIAIPWNRLYDSIWKDSWINWVHSESCLRLAQLARIYICCFFMNPCFLQIPKKEGLGCKLTIHGVTMATFMRNTVCYVQIYRKFPLRHNCETVCELTKRVCALTKKTSEPSRPSI